MYDRLQPLGVTLSHSALLSTMEMVSGHFNKELIDCIKAGNKYRIVGDNINFEVGVRHERKGKQGKHMVHWFGSAAIIQLLKFDDLPTICPQQDLLIMQPRDFMMNITDWDTIISNYAVIVGRILAKFLPWLKFSSKALEQPILGSKSNLLAKKSTVIPLAVQAKNEQKYADVVDVLDFYEDVLHQTAEEAGIPVGTVQVGGDQLTRDRFSGAKSLRAAALTPAERFAHLTPITFELFHLQMNLLTMFYRILYNSSCSDAATLHAQKIRLNRCGADGSDVKNHYDHCKELAVSFIHSYIVEAACQYFQLQDIESLPNLNVPDHTGMTDEEILQWVQHILRPFIESMIINRSRQFLNENPLDDDQEQLNITMPDGTRAVISVPIEKDKLYDYANNVLEVGLLFLNLQDAIKLPDRDRMLSIMKYLLVVFKGHNSRSKYALEILRFLCQQLALLSEKVATESFYGLFVNTKGKVDTNIPADLQMEYLVRQCKSHIKSMSSNATEQTIKKRSSAFFGLQCISEVYDHSSSTIIRANKHKVPSSLEDEKLILKDLRHVRPFHKVPGRELDNIRTMPKSPALKLNIEEFVAWLRSNQIKFFYELGR